jgi:Holliday junction DNA helicase RuvA
MRQTQLLSLTAVLIKGSANNMIDSIKGILKTKEPTYSVIDVGGIRFRFHNSVNAYEKLPEVGSAVELPTYLYVRQDILDLYGFKNEEEREIFLHLISISGIGPRMALTILSGASASEVKNRIITEDVDSLTVIPGIGLKTAKRIIVELKEKFVAIENVDITGLAGSAAESDEIKDVLQVLVSLGYKHYQAQAVLKKLKRDNELDGNLEDIIKKALAKM